MRFGHVDPAADDSDAVGIVESGLDYCRTGTVQPRPHNTCRLAPIRVIQISATQATTPHQMLFVQSEHADFWSV